jgi:hypothetical protein
MARMTSAELYRINDLPASPWCRFWKMNMYVDPEHNKILSDYRNAVIEEINSLHRMRMDVVNSLQVLTKHTKMPNRSQKNKLRKMLREFTRLYKKYSDIEFTLEWRRRHTGLYMKNIYPNKYPPGIFFITNHGRENDNLAKGDELFLGVHHTEVVHSG